MSSSRTPIPRSRVAALLESARDRTLLVLGDVMLDRYLWGNVSRISPEAPVPVVEVESETNRLGGAANVAHNVAALGARATLIGVVGEDHAAEMLRRELAERSLAVDGLVTDGSRPTSIKTRIVARHQQVVRADQESRDEISAAVETRLLSALRERFDRAHACVISDYGKGVITASLLAAILPELIARKIPIAVDPKEAHFFSYRGVGVVTPNLMEAGVAHGKALRSDADLEAAGTALREKLGCHAFLITRGEKGMSLFEAGRPRLDLPTVAREVYDVTGAGDTVVSVYATMLAAGATHPEAAEIANHAAGIVVREVGTAVASPAEILASFDGGA